MKEIVNIEEMMVFIMKALVRGDVVMLEDGGISHVPRPENDALIIEFEDGEPTGCMRAEKVEEFYEVKKGVLRCS